MFVYLTKAFWLLFSPVSLALILSGLAFLLSFTGWRRTMRVFALLGLAILGAATCTNLGDMMIRPLETRFQRPAEPAHIDGIVVLGGGMDSTVTSRTGSWELNQNGDRFVEALRLALRHPEARILASGGTAIGVDANESEAAAAGRFFEAFGIAPERLLLEEQSRNTEENAQMSLALAAPKPGETWLLVTSGFHMPRSVGLFRRAGFTIVPWPTDYYTAEDAGPRLSIGRGLDNLNTTSVAVREWAGLVGYWLAGKIDTVLPAP